MPKKDIFTREIKHLRARGNAAYREKDDEMLLKIVSCLCKTVEVQAKLAGDGGEGPVEIVFRDDEIMSAALQALAPAQEEARGDSGPCA
jgi:hypothetical protein